MGVSPKEPLAGDLRRVEGRSVFMDELLREFLTETNENIDLVDAELIRFEQDPNNTKILDNIFRVVHTIKGTCGFLNLPRLEALTHAAETLLGRFRDGPAFPGHSVTLILATIDRIKALLDAIERDHVEQAGDDTELIAQLQQIDVQTGGAAASAGKASVMEAFDEKSAAKAAKRASAAGVKGVEASRRDEDLTAAQIANQSIRVNLDTLEQLMTMVSELVLTRNQLMDIIRRHEDSEFKAPLQRLSNVTTELQEGVMKTRMQTIGNAWQKLPRVVRDLSGELGKRIEFEMHGADTEIDRQVLDLIKDPLIHMVRNSADHGIESPSARCAAGKQEEGTIRLSASHEGGYIIIEIADDGRGLDTARIKAAAAARGLALETEIAKMSEAQIHQFIFAPGFSTAGDVTSVSGRGVGMDVVRSNIEQIGGTINVKSAFGRGTSFTIKIPLTLAIVSALIVEAGGNRYAIPQVAVVELVSANNDSDRRIECIKDAEVLRLRNKLLPLVRLTKLLGIDRSDGGVKTNGFIVVTQVGSQMFGIVVDGVLDTEEIVVKPIASVLRHIPLFGGNTILGDGSVIMIIDPNGVARAIGGTDVEHRLADAEPVAEGEAAKADLESLLVFRAGSRHPKAVPLSLVTRLEKIDAEAIEVVTGRPLVQYRGQLMPLVPANQDLRIPEAGSQPLIVFTAEGRCMGLLVDEIVDIIEEKLEIELGSQHPGALGSALIRGQATEVIDIAHFLALAFEARFDHQGLISALREQSAKVGCAA